MTPEPKRSYQEMTRAQRTVLLRRQGREALRVLGVVGTDRLEEVIESLEEPGLVVAALAGMLAGCLAVNGVTMEHYVTQSRISLERRVAPE